MLVLLLIDRKQETPCEARCATGVDEHEKGLPISTLIGQVQLQPITKHYKIWHIVGHLS